MLLVEFKARCADLDAVHEKIQALDHRFVGEDHQIDTYFEVPNGRLKLREGTIEHTLIHYHRDEPAGLKTSTVTLFRPQSTGLGDVLQAALPVQIVVDKRRAIYFVGNVKLHLDSVKGLGTFVEVEAIDQDGSRSHAELARQCEHFKQVLGIRDEDLVAGSYADLLQALQTP
ncbi:MAG: class IV adenylate cyclase [Bacteroidota bacterium]